MVMNIEYEVKFLSIDPDDLRC